MDEDADGDLEERRKVAPPPCPSPSHFRITFPPPSLLSALSLSLPSLDQRDDGGLTSTFPRSQTGAPLGQRHRRRQRSRRRRGDGRGAKRRKRGKDENSKMSPSLSLQKKGTAREPMRRPCPHPSTRRPPPLAGWRYKRCARGRAREQRLRQRQREREVGWGHHESMTATGSLHSQNTDRPGDERARVLSERLWRLQKERGRRRERARVAGLRSAVPRASPVGRSRSVGRPLP